jgi:hypothetical protein
MSKPKQADTPSPPVPVSPKPPEDLDTFTVPVAVADAFSPLSPDQEKSAWAELRELLTTLIDTPANAADREQCDRLVKRLGLDPALSPLFLQALRERVELDKIIKSGVGAAETMSTCRQRADILTRLPATLETVNELESLRAKFDAAMARHTAAESAGLQLAALRFAFPELCSCEPFRLIPSVSPHKTWAAGMAMGLDISRGPASWREYKKPEPVKRRQYFVQPGSTQPISAPVRTVGRSPY